MKVVYKDILHYNAFNIRHITLNMYYHVIGMHFRLSLGTQIKCQVLNKWKCCNIHIINYPIERLKDKAMYQNDIQKNRTMPYRQ